MRRLVLVLLLLPPLAAAHPFEAGQGRTVEAHLVDAATLAVHHPSQLPLPGGPASNRSYWIEVRLADDGVAVDGDVLVTWNATSRRVTTEGGVARVPLGRPPAGALTVLVNPRLAGWADVGWVRFPFDVAAGSGPLEPEMVERWGFAAGPTWQTYDVTIRETGFAKLTLAWGHLQDGPGGFLSALHYRLPDGFESGAVVWKATDGPYAARVEIAASGAEVAIEPESPVPLSNGGTRLPTQGVFPAGTSIRLVQGVLSPADATRFHIAIEADPGVVDVRPAGSGAMRAYGAPDFEGGTQATVLVAGWGVSERLGREATIDLATGGLVLLQADPRDSAGEYWWTYADETTYADLYGQPGWWEAGGACAGRWTLRVVAGAFQAETFGLLHLADLTLPGYLGARYDTPIGGTECRR